MESQRIFAKAEWVAATRILLDPSDLTMGRSERDTDRNEKHFIVKGLRQERRRFVRDPDDLVRGLPGRT
jgi:hypothetical protein